MHKLLFPLTIIIAVFFISCAVDSVSLAQSKVKETELSAKELPAPIKDYLKQNYKGKKVVEAEMEESQAGKFYEVELKIDGKEVDLIFDENGNFLRKEMEGEEDDDDDNDE